MKFIYLLLSILTLSACTAKYDVIRHNSNQLSPNSSFYISNPEDGKYGSINYVNSGEMTRDALFNQLTILGVTVGKADFTKSRTESLIDARLQGYEILIYPTILHWEDRATEWSGLPDRAKIKLELIDTNTETIVDNTVLDLVGTLWTIGGLHPQDMVDEAVKEYFQQLFNLGKNEAI